MPIYIWLPALCSAWLSAGLLGGWYLHVRHVGHYVERMMIFMPRREPPTGPSPEVLLRRMQADFQRQAWNN